MSNVGFSISGMEKDSIRFGVNVGDKEVSYAKVNINGKSWEVSAWYTDAEYQNKGYGSIALKQAMVYAHACTEDPEQVEYTWNGVNQYVMDWLERKFNAKCTCPIAVLKYSVEYTKEAHKYELDVKSVLDWIKS